MDNLPEPRFRYNKLSGHHDLPDDTFEVDADAESVFASYDHEAFAIAHEAQREIELRRRIRDALIHAHRVGAEADTLADRSGPRPDHEAKIEALLAEESPVHSLAAATGLATAAIVGVGLWVGIAIGYFMFF